MGMARHNDAATVIAAEHGTMLLLPWFRSDANGNKFVTFSKFPVIGWAAYCLIWGHDATRRTNYAEPISLWQCDFSANQTETLANYRYIVELPDGGLIFDGMLQPSRDIAMKRLCQEILANGKKWGFI